MVALSHDTHGNRHAQATKRQFWDTASMKRTCPGHYVVALGDVQMCPHSHMATLVRNKRMLTASLCHHIAVLRYERHVNTCVLPP